jgi:type II secretory pathway pseudopilin PulG
MLNKKSSAGFGIIEFIVALSIFLIVAVTGVSAVVHSFSVNRLSLEESRANFLAKQGLEATISIKKQAWANLINGDYGLTKTSGFWEFFGTSDQNTKFDRAININDVYRNDQGQIIADNQGVLDANTKKITSTVSWDFAPSRQNQVKLTLYLTNWQGENVANECGSLCVDMGYESGTCEANANQCQVHDGTNLEEGDQYCNDGPNADTCCCYNLLPSPTPTPSITPTPTSTPTPTITPTPVNSCSDYCQFLATYINGICRQNSIQCSRNNETYESSGDQYCTGGASVDSCCCGK